MIEIGVTLFLAAVAGLLVLQLLRFEAANRETPFQVLQYGKRMRTLVGAAALGLVAIIVVVWTQTSGPESAQDVGALVGLIAIVGLGTLTTFRTRVRFDVHQIEVRGALGPLRSMRWESVERVAIVPWSSTLVFEDGAGRRLKVSIVLPGMPGLLDAIEQQLPRHVRGDLVEELRGRLGR